MSKQKINLIHCIAFALNKPVSPEKLNKIATRFSLEELSRLYMNIKKEVTIMTAPIQNESLYSEVETLKAIESVRQELVEVSKRGDSLEMGDVHARLVSLYASLNVHNVISAIERIQYKKVA